MRFNDSATLVSVSAAQGADGSFSESRERREVFANERTVGATALMAARAVGFQCDAEVQVRSCDYAGEQECEFHGTAYNVERAKNSGEFTTLTLGRKVSGV